MSGITFTAERHDEEYLGALFGHVKLLAHPGKGKPTVSYVVLYPAEADAFAAMVDSHAGVVKALTDLLAGCDWLDPEQAVLPQQQQRARTALAAAKGETG